MKDAVLPYVGMVSMQFIQVGLIVGVKKATSSGMTKFSMVFYSNAIAALFLLPISFLAQRSTRPPITFSLLCKFFLLGLIGCITQICGNVGVQITPASFGSAINNLTPAFTFVLAALFRLEAVDFRSSTTLAKSIGTLVSIAGALIVTLYKGPALLSQKNPASHSNNHLLLLHHHLKQEKNLVVGGLLLIIDCVAASFYIITQAFLLQICKAELIIVFFYSFFVAILSAVLSLVLEGDLSAWSLQPPVRLLAILYSGIVGSVIQQYIIVWCLHKRGPLFIAVFHPIGIVIATIVGIFFLGDILYLGSLVGSVVIVIGFYSVMWGKAKEQKVAKEDNGVVRSLESTSEKAPLLQNVRETQV